MRLPRQDGFRVNDLVIGRHEIKKSAGLIDAKLLQSIRDPVPVRHHVRVGLYNLLVVFREDIGIPGPDNEVFCKQLQASRVFQFRVVNNVKRVT